MIRTLARQDLERFKIPSRAESPVPIAEVILPIPLPPKQRKQRQTRDNYTGGQHYARPGSISTGQPVETVPPRCRTIIQHGAYTGRSLHGSSTHLANALPYNSDYSHLHSARNSPGPSYCGSPSNCTSREQPPEYQALAPVQDREVRNYPSTELRAQSPAPRNHSASEVPSPHNYPVTEVPSPRNYPVTEVPSPRNYPVTEVPSPRNYPVTEVRDHDQSPRTYPMTEMRDQSPRTSITILSHPSRSRSGSLRNITYPMTDVRDQSPRTITSNFSEPIHLSNRSINYPEGPQHGPRTEHSGSLRSVEGPRIEHSGSRTGTPRTGSLHSVNYPSTELRDQPSGSPHSVAYLSTEPKISPV